MLVVLGTDNFYKGLGDEKDINAQSPVFWVAVSIALIFVLANTILLTYYGIKTSKVYSKIPKKH